jgi:putative transposase
VSVVAKRHEISEQTIYTWRKRFGGFQANQVRRLKQLETETVGLRKLVVERDLEIEIMKKVAAKNIWSAPSVSGMRRSYLSGASSQRPCSSSIRDTEASDRTASFAKKIECKLTSFFQQARQHLNGASGAAPCAALLRAAWKSSIVAAGEAVSSRIRYSIVRWDSRWIVATSRRKRKRRDACPINRTRLVERFINPLLRIYWLQSSCSAKKHNYAAVENHCWGRKGVPRFLVRALRQTGD